MVKSFASTFCVFVGMKDGGGGCTQGRYWYSMLNGDERVGTFGVPKVDRNLCPRIQGISVELATPTGGFLRFYI